MSGGSFDYAYQTVEQFADALHRRLEEPKESGDFTPVVLKKLREIEEVAIKAAQLMKEVEWLYSCDTSEDSFLVRIEKIVSSNVK